MNAKTVVRLLTIVIVISSFLVNPYGLTKTQASSSAEIGGFLFPFTGVKSVSNGPVGHSYNAVDFVRTGSDPEHFAILAPKDGTVVSLDDSSNYGGTCSGAVYAPNYLVLGHGPFENGKYHHYSLFLHLSYNSIPDNIQVNTRVRAGQVLGEAGNTGNFQSDRSTDDPDRGTHLHMEVSQYAPSTISGTVSPCTNYVGTLPPLPYPQRSIPDFNSKSSFGFEETANNWPPSGTLTSSYNESGGLSGSSLCNTDSSLTKVVLYNHIDYGGECVLVPAPENGFQVPENKHISSVFLNPSWINFLQGYYHTLTLWDAIPNDPLHLMREFHVISNSIPRLESIGWNDRVKYVHNAAHSSTPWLLEESYVFQAPFNVNIHIRVANDPEFNAWRVCFDGENCQENAAPINELYYTWNTYGWADGNHTISIQYRRTSDNLDWNNADYYETSFYLNANRQTYAPCGTNVNGARLVSGSDCIIVTTNVADMAPVAWADRSNLNITAQGYDVLAYDSSDFRGPASLIRNGQTANVGGNISGIELRQPLPDSYVPTEPLRADAGTIAYLPMDEAGGVQVYSQIGSLTGTVVNPASFTEGRFGSAIHSVNPPDGGGINFGSQDFGSALTVEMFVKMDDTNGDQRLATQLGGGPNTGKSKWLIGLAGGRFRIWSCWISGCHEGFSLEGVQTGRWYYVMFTYDGATTAKLYVDSVLQTTLNMDGTMPAGSTTFEIAKGENIYGCNCTIDDVRISSIVRVPLGPPAPTPTPIPTSIPTNTPTPTATNTPTSTPTSTPSVAPCPAITDWKGEYWNNDTLAGMADLCRNDQAINFHWDFGSPDPLISDDHFSARWTRDIYFSAGQYRFDVFHDDGARLYIDGTLVFDDWCSGCRKTDPVYSTLTAGTHRVVMEMYDSGGWATAQLGWQLEQPPTLTPTPTATHTPSPTATYTPSQQSMNTGFLNPSSSAAQKGGDNNGYEVNPAGASADDGVFAVDNNSGSNTNASCTNNGKDKHIYYNYTINFNLPGTAAIQGIEVRLDAKSDSSSGSPKLCVQLSWDGGRSWTAAKSTAILSAAEQTFILGSVADTWGRTWTSSQVSSANLRVRVIQVASSTARDFSLDWISVRVTYK
jgi:murein DD-endopeptidase MepM/ murein hydrolase activator NlpD